MDWEIWGLEIPAEEVAECVEVVYQEACGSGVSAPALLVGLELGVAEFWYLEAVLAVELPVGEGFDAVEAVEA